MRLYSLEDLRDYHYLTNKYMELTDEADNLYQKSDDKNAVMNGIEWKYLLTQVKTTKGMMDGLGTEVPDDKAKELGFEL